MSHKFDVDECLHTLGRNPDTIDISVPITPIFEWPKTFCHSALDIPTHEDAECEILRVPELENMDSVDEWWLILLKQSQFFMGFAQIEMAYASSAIILQSLYRYYGESSIDRGDCFMLTAVTRLFSDEEYRSSFIEVLRGHSAYPPSVSSGYFYTDCYLDFRFGNPEIPWIENRIVHFDYTENLAVELAERFESELTADQLAMGLLEGDGIAGWLVQVAEPNSNDFQDLMGDSQSSIEWLIAGLCRHRDLAAVNMRHAMTAIMNELAQSEEVSDILFMGTGWHEIQAQAEVFNSAFARHSSIAYIRSRSMSVSWVSDVEFSQE